MFRWLALGLACALGMAWACGNAINGGGNGLEGGSADGGLGAPCTSDCAAPYRCNVVPGTETGVCVAACGSDGDCPAFLTCKTGLCAADCSEASGCAGGQSCSGLIEGPFGGECQSNADCRLGAYCLQREGMCMPYMVCIECVGGCPTCTANWQCGQGQVCTDGTCQTCTSDSQCGPSAKCSATHSSFQCTCSKDGDCATMETCNDGVCAHGNANVDDPDASCKAGKVYMDGKCGGCSTFEDCNPGANGPRVLPGLACVDGVCTHCTANSQCGGGQACVDGTCGTCITSAQCGPGGSCMDGFCTCTSSAQCAAGQRCGAGVCVPM
jgi:hypothetical protein